MRKIITLAVLSLVPFLLDAQETNNFWTQNGFFHMNYAQSTLSQSGESIFDYGGGGFSVGTSMYLHKRPIAGIAKLGIDISFMDINYEYYQIQYTDGTFNTKDYELHKADFSIQAGPSLTLNPFWKVGLKVYGKAAPALVYFANDSSTQSFCLYRIYGAALSIGGVGVGIEQRIGSGNCANIFPFRKSSEAQTELLSEGFRAYLCFRFK